MLLHISLHLYIIVYMKMFNALKVTVYFGIKYSKDKGAS